MSAGEQDREEEGQAHLGEQLLGKDGVAPRPEHPLDLVHLLRRILSTIQSHLVFLSPDDPLPLPDRRRPLNLDHEPPPAPLRRPLLQQLPDPRDRARPRPSAGLLRPEEDAHAARRARLALARREGRAGRGAERDERARRCVVQAEDGRPGVGSAGAGALAGWGAWSCRGGGGRGSEDGEFLVRERDQGLARAEEGPGGAAQRVEAAREREGRERVLLWVEGGRGRRRHGREGGEGLLWEREGSDVDVGRVTRG